MHRLQTHFLPVGALALLLLGAGCGSKNASTGNNASSAATNNDDALANQIKAKLYSDPTVKGAPVNVSVKDGDATLSGDVPNANVELAAMKAANDVSGIQHVNDQMKVNPSMAAGQTPANNSSPSPAQPESTAAASVPPVQPDTRPAPSRAAVPPPAPAEPRTVTYAIPAGDRVAVRMTDSVDSSKNQVGQTFRASLDAPLTARGRVVVPAGAPAVVTLVSDQKAGRIRGRNEITLQLTSIEYKGHTYAVDSTTFADTGKAKGRQTAVRSGIGAAAGALIGGLAGGGKGAGIGAAVGGGGTLGYQFFTHGAKVKIPSETVVNFRLESPLTVPVTRSTESRSNREE